MHVVHGFFLTDESFRAFEKHDLAIYSIPGNVPHVIQEALIAVNTAALNAMVKLVWFHLAVELACIFPETFSHACA
jgi:hypothetical protein